LDCEEIIKFWQGFDKEFPDKIKLPDLEDHRFYFISIPFKNYESFLMYLVIGISSLIGLTMIVIFILIHIFIINKKEKALKN